MTMRISFTLEEFEQFVSDAQDESYSEGFDQGVKVGHADGYEDGYDQGYTEARAIFAGTAAQPEVTNADLVFATDEIPQIEARPCGENCLVCKGIEGA